jgi:hypothetical protein
MHELPNLQKVEGHVPLTTIGYGVRGEVYNESIIEWEINVLY